MSGKSKDAEKELRERQRALRRSIAERSSKTTPPSTGADLSAGATAAISATAASEPHALTFRVMRLCKPAPSRRPSMLQIDTAAEVPADKPAPALTGWEGEGCLCGIGAAVVLPQSFGTIQAGEMFRAFVCVYNRAVTDVALVKISLEIHLNDKLYYRVPNTDAETQAEHGESISIFASKTTHERLVDCRLSETGVHVLVCMAEYTDHNGQVRQLRQYFRFNVTAPLKFSVSVVPIDEEAGEDEAHITMLVAPTRFLVLLKLTNTSPGPMKFTEVQIEPTSAYSISAMEKREAPTAASTKTRILDGGHAGCGAGDMQSFSFLATALQNDGRSAEGAGPGKTIGRPTVRWRAVGGQEGVLECVGTIAEPGGRVADLEVSIEAIPRRIVAHQPFMARCRVRNNSDSGRRLYLQVRRDKVGEVVPVGVSGQNLGHVPGKSVLETLLRMVPLTPGRHRVSGVRVVDIDSRASFACEPAEGPEVHVHSS